MSPALNSNSLTAETVDQDYLIEFDNLIHQHTKDQLTIWVNI
jgi:hypothetical protein